MGWLVLLAAAAGIFWLVTYGEAYWENLEVKSLVLAAANQCYRDDDQGVRQTFFHKLELAFEVKEEDHGRVVSKLKIDFDRDDLRIERTKVPAYVHVWFTYSRNIKVPLLGQERQVTFTDHAEQDLSPVKW
jgi:hypothetical protein